MGIKYFASNKLSILTTTALKKNKITVNGISKEKNTGTKKSLNLRLHDRIMEWHAMDIIIKR
jgi:hypothetical protein